MRPLPTGLALLPGLVVWGECLSPFQICALAPNLEGDGGRRQGLWEVICGYKVDGIRAVTEGTLERARPAAVHQVSMWCLGG